VVLEEVVLLEILNQDLLVEDIVQEEEDLALEEEDKFIKN